MKIEFGNLEIGEEFFDPNSGEDWKKINENQASIISGGDYLIGKIDTFQLDDEIIVGE